MLKSIQKHTGSQCKKAKILYCLPVAVRSRAATFWTNCGQEAIPISKGGWSEVSRGEKLLILHNLY